MTKAMHNAVPDPERLEFTREISHEDSKEFLHGMEQETTNNTSIKLAMAEELRSLGLTEKAISRQLNIITGRTDG